MFRFSGLLLSIRIANFTKGGLPVKLYLCDPLADFSVLNWKSNDTPQTLEAANLLTINFL